MSFHMAGCGVPAVVLFARYRGISFPSLGDVTRAGRADRDLLHAQRPTSSTARAVRGAADRRALGDGIPERRLRRRAASEPTSTRRRWKGWCCSVVLAALMRAGALKRPGFITGRARARPRRRPLDLRAIPRSSDAQLGFLWGGLTMGMPLSLPLMLAGIASVAGAMRHERATRLMPDDTLPS